MLRGNLSFSTINIVKLALECREEQDQQKRIDMFFAKLDHMLELTAKQLDDRFQFQKTAFAKQFPLLMKSLWIGADKLGPNDTIESVINQGTLGIGFIGLAECLVALTGKHHGESEESQALGLKIVGYMRQRINDFCEQYHHNYSVLATPAEGLSGKFTKKDRKQFGVIPGVTDRDYYTNSNHVPVYYKCSARHKAEVEAPYHEMTRGGHIFYVEIDGDATHNPQVIMSVVDMMDQLDMGYGSVNHNRNRCMDCGYENADDHLEKCPKCGSTNIDKLQRITGYLVGTTDRWNSGKLAELNDRVTQGFRTSIYCAGCRHKCPGCHNPQSWDFKGGREMSTEEIMKIIVADPYANVTFTGGDPMYQCDGFAELARAIHRQTNKDIWCYTGFSFESLITRAQRELLELLDVLVDGPYIEKLRDPDLLFRGSSNQRLIDVQKSLYSGQTVLWNPDVTITI